MWVPPSPGLGVVRQSKVENVFPLAPYLQTQSDHPPLILPPLLTDCGMHIHIGRAMESMNSNVNFIGRCLCAFAEQMIHFSVWKLHGPNKRANQINHHISWSAKDYRNRGVSLSVVLGCWRIWRKKDKDVTVTVSADAFLQQQRGCLDGLCVHSASELL